MSGLEVVGDDETIAKPPTGIRADGRRLWTAVLSEYDLDEPELALLRQACRTVDHVEALDRIVRKDGPLIETAQGLKPHPALVEARQQRIAFARIQAALRLPIGENTETAPIRQRRTGVRGFYGIQGAVQ